MFSGSFARALLIGAAVALAGVFAFLMLRPDPAPNVRPGPNFNPADFVRSRAKLDAPYVVTDYDVVDAMLAMADVRPDGQVVDLGSGDGRILIAAARSHGARGLGVEIDPARIRESNDNARAAGVAHRVTFRRENLFRTPLAEADVLTLYLLREINLRLRPRILAEMRPGTRVVSHDFDMGDWHYDERQQVGSATIYMWVVPARAGGSYQISADGRSGVLTLEQRYQHVTGTIAINGVTTRVEQGRINGDRIRFLANLGDGRRTFEGRIADGRIESDGRTPLAGSPGGLMPLALFGLAIAWGVMLAFGGMEFDRGLLIFAYAGGRPELAPAARWLTELGGAAVLLSVTAAGALILARRRDWRACAMLLAVTLSGRLLVTLQKDWTARLRPDANDHLVAVESLSFPSGHAANSAMVWLMLALLLPRSDGLRTIAVWAAAWLAILIGGSRVMLGVHWPSDVIAGWSFGLFWMLLLLWVAGHSLEVGRQEPAKHFPLTKENDDGASGTSRR